MSDRRKFIKSIAGALVASAMPKSLLSIEGKPQVTFYEQSLERRRKRMSEQFEKAIWAGDFNTLKK